MHLVATPREQYFVIRSTKALFQIGRLYCSRSFHWIYEYHNTIVNSQRKLSIFRQILMNIIQETDQKFKQEIFILPRGRLYILGNFWFCHTSIFLAVIKIYLESKVVYNKNYDVMISSFSRFQGEGRWGIKFQFPGHYKCQNNIPILNQEFPKGVWTCFDVIQKV